MTDCFIRTTKVVLKHAETSKRFTSRPSLRPDL